MRSLPESFESAFISPATNLIYMVEIEGDDGNTIRIASREGHSISVYDGVDGDGDELYIDELYHDADLKISTISESVDLNSKAVKLSEITITCSNFPIFMTDTEQRFSDLLKNANGKTINIKIKPDGSTDTLNLAEGVVTRVKHDSNAITISANDSTLDVIDMQLPKLENRLDKDVNTYDYYHDKYVPLLYGHLRAAPAMVHLSDLTEITSVDNGTVKLLPDTSYLDGSDMEGVKGFEKDIELETMNGTEVFSPSRNCLEMRRQDVVRMKVGENVCDVPCLPYIQSRSKIIDKHDYKQWDSVGNYVSLNTTDENGSKTEITNNAVWCAINQKPYPNDDNKRTIQMEFFENTKWKAFVNSHELSEISTGHETSAGKLTYKVGVEFFSFDTLSGYELDDRRDDAEKLKFENDVHFIGNFKGVHKNFYGAANAYHHDLTRFFPVFSSPNVESNEFVGGDTGADYSYYLGYPKELHKWRFITSQGNQESYNAIQGNHSNDLENMHNDLNRAKFHMAGASDFDYDDPELTYNSYITSFISGRFNFDADNCFVGRHYTWHKNIYPVMDATTLAIYYFADGLNSTSQYPNFSFDLETYWRDLEMRKVWLNTNMFERDYFLNARGKRSPNGDGSGLIRGTMFIKYEGTDQPNFDNPQNDSSAEATKRDNIHLTELYKYLTDPELETIRHEGKEYQIMLMAQQSDGNITYYYDFDIENVIFCEDNLPYMYDGGQDAYIVGGEEIAHSCGWMFKFRCRGKGPKEMQFGINHLANGVRLVYGKKNLSYRPDDAKVTIMSIDHIETPELDLFNNANGYEMGTFTDPYKPHGYTLLTYIDPIVANRLYEHPAEIIRDLLLFQAETSAGFDYDKFDKLLFENPNLKFAFSLTEPQSVKEILEKICSQSRFFYRHNMNTNQITIDQIKEQYTPEDVISTIDVDDLYRCSFDLTKKEDLCFAGVEVKYGYNYATEKYDKTTGTLSVGDKLQLYKEYYGVESVDAYKVVVEADYIHDEPTAIYLRDYLFGKNKNQNLLCKLELPLSSGFKYEVGDIVNFNKNPENTKPYGNDITSGYMKIDQNVYPFFIITKVSLTANSVKLELEQLHNTTPVYQAGLLGDVNLDGVVNGDDVTLLIEMALATDQSIYSPEQLANGDLVYDAENHQLLAGDGTVDLADAQQLNAWWRAEQEQ